MGYYSNYKLTIHAPDAATARTIHEALSRWDEDTDLRMGLDIASPDYPIVIMDSTVKYDTLNDVKWYECEEHLKALSKGYTNTTFELRRTGEDGCEWRIYARNGRVDTIEPVITWPKPDAFFQIS